MRTGIVAKKIGMTRVFSNDGVHIPVTILQVQECQVVNIKTDEKHGYTALQIGVESAKQHRLTKPLQGYFAKLEVEPRKKLQEFRVNHDQVLTLKQEITADHFTVGQFIDVSAKSIGKGFAGVMKRHNFSGHRASHGASIAHRTQGSTGSCQDPGKVWKNKKMAGQLGNKKITIQNLQVHQICLQNNLIIVKGAVPGSKGTHIIVRDSVKMQRANQALLKTANS